MLITGKPKAGQAENGLGRNDTHDLLITNELYRMLLDKQQVLEKTKDLPEIVLSQKFRIDFETVKTFRKSGGNYLCAKQWEDLTVEVRIS